MPESEKGDGPLQHHWLNIPALGDADKGKISGAIRAISQGCDGRTMAK